MNDLISRQETINALCSECQGRCVPCKSYPCSEVEAINALPTAESDVIRCKECIYYDPEHIENNGIRYEYKDMPKDAFDKLGTGLVHIEYGINVGGRCCRDYNVGYSEDKRVFVPETNYCGRAERRADED